MGLFGVVEENVLIQAGACSLTVLPPLGGKIASLSVGGVELLQGPLAPRAPRTRTMAFDASDAGGWDECLPSVAACGVELPNGVAEIPDHGDLWRVAWKPVTESSGRGSWLEDDANDSSPVTLRGECFSLPLALDRTLALSEQENGWRVDLGYKLTNSGPSPLPWSWAAHPLFAVDPGDRLILPETIDSLCLEGSGGNRLGKNGDTISWPVAKLAGGRETDLSSVQPPDSGIGDKLFAGPLTQKENWCALERASARLRIKVTFDPALTPYLGLWICYGGWPDRPGPKQNCIAMEPATAPVDSLAQTGSWTRVLAANESFAWTMHLEIERI